MPVSTHRRSGVSQVLWLVVAAWLSTSVKADSIAVSNACVAPGASIEVSFQKDDDANFNRNWIALYPSDSVSEGMSSLPDGILWVWTCGNQGCNSNPNPSQGSVTFNSASQSWDSPIWPLPEGRYRAVLSTGNSAPWPALAVSGEIEIGSCGPNVSVQQQCFEAGTQQVGVSFDKLEEGDVFVAIYKAEDSTNLQSLMPEGIQGWRWACFPNCNGDPVTSGAFSIPGFSGYDPGEYRAIAIANGSRPWQAMAASSIFRVGNCQGGPNPTPAPAPTPGPPGPNDDLIPIIAAARTDIENLIASNGLLVGKFLRLAFHDCVGICDGCVDMTNPDNAGLVMPIQELESVVDRFSDDLSRTDVWMLAAVVASDVSKSDNSDLDFPFQWVGRKTCEELNNNNCGVNARGQRSPCAPMAGPHRALCHGDISGTETLLQFMSDNFGFNAQQTAAIMGAHSVGAMRNVNVGFEGRRGWDLTNQVLDNGYYHELVGDSDPVQSAPDWVQVVQDNSRLNGIPDRFQYRLPGPQFTGMTMLNSDIAMVRRLEEDVNLVNGRVTCNFKGNQNLCPSNTRTMPHMIRYKQSSSLFLEDFREALDMMVDNGYSRRGVDCPDGMICTLSDV